MKVRFYPLRARTFLVPTGVVLPDSLLESYDGPELDMCCCMNCHVAFAQTWTHRLAAVWHMLEFTCFAVSTSRGLCWNIEAGSNCGKRNCLDDGWVSKTDRSLALL